MKRLILTIAVAVFMLSSCDTPISSNNNQPSTDQPLSEAAVPNITYSLDAVQPDTFRTAAWQQFKAQNGAKWRVRWNKHTGLPASVFSGLSEKKYDGNTRQAARRFLTEHQPLFGIADLNTLKYVKTKTNRGIRHVTFNQTVDGVPVYEAEYKVHLRPNGSVDMANGDYYPNVQVSTRAGISQSQARSFAVADMNITDSKALQMQSEKVIYRDGENFRLAWKLVLFRPDPFADWFYMIDAQSGEILEKLNRLTDVTGDGDVYPTHPGLSSVTNKPLFGLLGNGNLDGTYVNVENGSTARAFSSSHSFVYATTNTHFDEVSLYYHVDNFRRNFIENLDAANLLFDKLTATAHDNSTCPNNACFSPSTQDIYFSDGYDFAKEDKVVHHEYGHAVIYDIQSGIQSFNDEEGAISEGTPDYFAGSFTDRSKIGDHAVPFAERDMNNPDITSYSQYQSQEPVVSHLGGQFFSSILWDLYKNTNPTAVNFLVYDALYRVTGAPDFVGFRDAMIAASNAAYGGLYNNAIQTAFGDKGVGETPPPPPPPPSPFTVNIDGTQNTYVGAQNTWTVDISGSSPPFNYSWQKKDEGQSLFYVVGNSSTYTETISGTDDFVLKIVVTNGQNESSSDQISVRVNDNIPFH
jgi:Zn-dependent metalloprotease